MVASWALSLCSLVACCVCTYVLTYVQSYFAISGHSDKTKPPLVPYLLPFIANTIGFARDTAGYLQNITKCYGYSTPVTISLIGGRKIHLVSNPDYVVSMLSLKTSRTLTMKNSVILAMSTVFGAPPHIMRIWHADDSGINTVPLRGSNVKHSNRVFMNSHKSSLKYLSGTNLRFIVRRFMENFNKQMNADDRLQNSSAATVVDLYPFLQKHMFIAVTEALCGRHILKVCPTLAQDFWAFDSASPELFQDLPRWMNSKGYASRDRMLHNLKKWHALANEHLDPTLSAGEGPDEDEYYGTKWLRDRAIEHSKVEGFDADACAADDLGLFFAANGNAIPAAFWLIYYILTTPGLLARVRAEIAKCISPVSDEYDLAELTANHFLSSIYAETLRLRNASLVTRTPIESSYTLGKWRFDRGELIAVSNWITCRNPAVWSTVPSRTKYSVDDFWPERFLIDPEASKEDPSRPVSPGREDANDSQLRFSLEGLGGGWVPYGGGSTICPGRNMAKAEILGAMATLLGRYQIDIAENQEAAKPDLRFMMLGMLPPKNSIRVRISKLRQ